MEVFGAFGKVTSDLGASLLKTLQQIN